MTSDEFLWRMCRKFFVPAVRAGTSNKFGPVSDMLTYQDLAETEAIFCYSSPYLRRNFSQSRSASTGTKTFPFVRKAAGAKILRSEFPTHILIESAGALSWSSSRWTGALLSHET
jgi:hypothetical protein